MDDNWDEHLDRGTADGQPPRRLSRCLVCGFRGTAAQGIAHHVLTKHAISYRGVQQVCTLAACECQSKRGNIL